MRWDYPWINGEINKYLDLYVDSDWGADETERKSTSVGCVLVNRQALAFWSVTQPTPSLSSGEADFKSMTNGLFEALYIRNFAEWMGNSFIIRLHSDSSAAIGMCKRLGKGKRVKHIEIPYFFIQHLVRSGVVTIHKMPTDVNMADL